MSTTFSGYSGIALLFAMAMWGSSFVAFKFAILVYDPIVVVFGRMALALMLFMCTFSMWKSTRFDKRDLWTICFMALCEPCMYFIFEGQALRYTTAVQAGMVASILPVLVALAAWWLLAERLTTQTWIGLILALGGVVWVSISGVETETSPNPLLGNFLEFLAMSCAAGYTISLKRLSAKYSPWFLTAMQALIGTIFFFPLLLLPSTRLPDVVNVSAIMAVLYLGSCISVGAYGLYNYGISKMPAWQASAFINLIPVFSLVFGWFFLGERLSMQQLCGAGVTLVGVLLTQDLITIPWLNKDEIIISVEQ